MLLISEYLFLLTCNHKQTCIQPLVCSKIMEEGLLPLSLVCCIVRASIHYNWNNWKLPSISFVARKDDIATFYVTYIIVKVKVKVSPIYVLVSTC